MKLVRIVNCVSLLGLILLATGCGQQVQPGAESGVGSLQADAYRFSARLFRDGSPTTLRLELYRSDSLVGLYGRAYLGRTALVGRVTPDSIVMYFPPTDDVLMERLADALEALAGRGVSRVPSLSSLLSGLPDSVTLPPRLLRVRNDTDKRRPRYLFYDSAATWQLELTYREERDVWRLYAFEFTAGENSLRGTRDRFRAAATVSRERFYPSIPVDARRILVAVD